MNGKMLLSMARLGFIFNFAPPNFHNFIFVTHNTNRDVTDFDRERVADVFPGTTVAIMDDGKTIVAL